jgi:two-component system sensor histidine kinase KdpD
MREHPESERPNPEALLRQVQAEARAAQRGQLKIFLGYTSGVGKSFKLFDEGRRRRARGEDVIIGAVQSGIPDDVTEVMRGIEAIPAHIVDGIPRHGRRGCPSPSSGGVPDRRPGLRQPARQPASQAVRGR